MAVRMDYMNEFVAPDVTTCLFFNFFEMKFHYCLSLQLSDIIVIMN